LENDFPAQAFKIAYEFRASTNKMFDLSTLRLEKSLKSCHLLSVPGAVEASSSLERLLD